MYIRYTYNLYHCIIDYHVFIFFESWLKRLMKNPWKPQESDGWDGLVEGRATYLAEPLWDYRSSVFQIVPSRLAEHDMAQLQGNTWEYITDITAICD